MNYGQILRIANRIVDTIAPFCEKCYIAGSIRRKSAECRDIEIVCKPLSDNSYDLFGDVSTTTRIKAFRDAVSSIGSIKKGNADGRYCKIILPETELQLDLFMPAAEDFYRQYAIRTGSGLYSWKVIAQAWVAKGWCGTDSGLRMRRECEEAGSTWKCIVPNPVLPPVWQSEEAFFEWLGIDWISPEKRDV